MLFCTHIIVSSIGSSFVIRNSYAQAQQQLQQAPTVAYPWSNNLQISPGSTTQPLCPVGICSQSMNPASTTTQSQSSASISTTSTTPTNRADPTSFKNLNTKTFTNKSL
ncbi:MAG: hypothetical protein WA364_05575 [Candidatus Nitrosopolaris sp.]